MSYAPIPIVLGSMLTENRQPKKGQYLSLDPSVQSKMYG